MPSLKAMAREAQKRPKTSISKQPINPKHNLFKSTERVVDSDLESETESESSNDSEDNSIEPVVTVAKVNGHKIAPVAVDSGGKRQKSNEDEVDDEDTSEDENRSEVEEDERRVESDGGVETSGTERSSDGDRSDESEKESESSDANSIELEKPSGPKKAKSFVVETSRSVNTTGQIGPSPRKATSVYVPPDGFDLVSAGEEIKTKVLQIFRSSNLAGKQLWYITAPAAVPISAVQQVSLDDVRLGKPAFTLNGRKYGFVVQQEAEEKSETKVLIPDGNSIGYRIGQKAIDQILHLQHIVDLPDLVTRQSSQIQGSQSPPEVSRPATKPVRKQPEGLKMRFRPIGFGKGKTGTIGSSSSSGDSSSTTDCDTDEEMEDAPPAFRRPPGVKQMGNKAAEQVREVTSSEENSSGSEAEGNNSLNAAKMNAFSTDSATDSESSSEDSDSEKESKPLSTPRKVIQTSHLSLKRKLSDLGDDKTHRIATKRSKTNDTIPKTTETKHTTAVRAEQPLNTRNGAARGSILPSGSSPAPRSTTKITPVPPPGSSNTHLNPPTSAKSAKKSILIPPPQIPKNLPSRQQIVRSSVTSPLQNQSPPVGTMLSPIARETAGRMVMKSPGLPAHEMNGAKSKKDRKKEIGRMKEKENEESSSSKVKSKESVGNQTTATLKSSTDISPPSGNARKHFSTIKPPPRSSLEKVLSQDTSSIIPPKMDAQVSEPKMSHTASSKAKSVKKIGTIQHTPNSRESITPGPPVKVSVILPPKLTKSTSK